MMVLSTIFRGITMHSETNFLKQQLNDIDADLREKILTIKQLEGIIQKNEEFKITLKNRLSSLIERDSDAE